MLPYTTLFRSSIRRSTSVPTVPAPSTATRSAGSSWNWAMGVVLPCNPSGPGRLPHHIGGEAGPVTVYEHMRQQASQVTCQLVSYRSYLAARRSAPAEPADLLPLRSEER